MTSSPWHHFMLKTTDTLTQKDIFENTTSNHHYVIRRSKSDDMVHGHPHTLKYDQMCSDLRVKLH